MHFLSVLLFKFFQFYDYHKKNSPISGRVFPLVSWIGWCLRVNSFSKPNPENLAGKTVKLTVVFFYKSCKMVEYDRRTEYFKATHR